MPTDVYPLPLPLAGRIVLVTGVSRQAGIALAVATEMHRLGATVFATGWRPHDDAMPWGAGPSIDAPFAVHSHDLADAAVPKVLIDEVIAAHGAIDVVLAVHAQSSSSSLLETTAEELDSSWAVNVRSVVLLARHLAERHDSARRCGRMIWFTSGQALGPMSGELPYAITKGALHQMTISLADALADAGIVANCINPGPVDTGYASPQAHTELVSMFPPGRWGTVDDVTNLVSFLVSDAGQWISGQVINSEGGFRRGR